MRVICVDDEELILQMTVSLCEEMDEISEVNGFLSAGETLDWLQDHEPDIALLDINLPDMDGITLAKNIQEIYPDMAIIFLTSYT
ncbi:MAG: response regulator transcription factor, partial [Firmicutes bacterium]|nr:response regulator transcription factor [Bacillota bacterium]